MTNKQKMQPDLKAIHALAASSGGVFAVDVTRKRDGAEEHIVTRKDISPEKIPEFYNWLRSEWSGGGHYIFRAYDLSGHGVPVVWDLILPGTPLQPADVAQLDRQRQLQAEATRAEVARLASGGQGAAQFGQAQFGQTPGASTLGGAPAQFGMSPAMAFQQGQLQQFGALGGPGATQYTPVQPGSPLSPVYGASPFGTPFNPYNQFMPLQQPQQDRSIESLKEQMNLIQRERDKDRDTFERRLQEQAAVAAQERSAQAQEKLRQEFGIQLSSVKEQLAAVTTGFKESMQALIHQQQQQMQVMQQQMAASQNNPIVPMMTSMMASQSQASIEATKQVQAAAQAGIDAAKETAKVLSEDKRRVDPVQETILKSLIDRNSPDAQRKWAEAMSQVSQTSLQMTLQAMQLMAESQQGESPWVGALMQGLQTIGELGSKYAERAGGGAPPAPNPKVRALGAAQPREQEPPKPASDLDQFGRLAPSIKEIRDGVRQGWDPETTAQKLVEMFDKAQGLDPEAKMLDRMIARPMDAVRRLLPSMDDGYRRQVLLAIQRLTQDEGGGEGGAEESEEAEPSEPAVNGNGAAAQA